MGSNAEQFILRAAERTAGRAGAVAAAFVVLAQQSWPKREVIEAFRRAEKESAPVSIVRALATAFDVANAEYPTAMFWWKTEKSEFLGFCPRFAQASGLGALQLLGRTDADPNVAWNRQAALYMRDDREVLASRSSRFDILERQDRGGSTVWLRTSKVPYESLHGSGTVGGFDTIPTTHAVQLAKARK